MSTPFATCDLCDSHKNDTSGDFRVLPPVFRDFGAVRVGADEERRQAAVDADPPASVARSAGRVLMAWV